MAIANKKKTKLPSYRTKNNESLVCLYKKKKGASSIIRYITYYVSQFLTIHHFIFFSNGRNYIISFLLYKIKYNNNYNLYHST